MIEHLKFAIIGKIFNLEFANIKTFLWKNLYPPQLIEKQFKKFLENVGKNQQNNEETAENRKNVSYQKLPFIGTYSKFVQNKIKEICSNFCKNTDVKIVFTSNKVSSFFSTKDKVPNALLSHVVYFFKCAGCNASYVGQTTRHFSVRVNEHLYKKSQPTGIFKHLEADQKCRSACNETCFKVIDRDSSPFRLQIKEAIHNEWLKPNINKQRQLLKMGILI